LDNLHTKAIGRAPGTQHMWDSDGAGLLGSFQASPPSLSYTFAHLSVQQGCALTHVGTGCTQVKELYSLPSEELVACASLFPRLLHFNGLRMYQLNQVHVPGSELAPAGWFPTVTGMGSWERWTGGLAPADL
jgi:hypothetical protein